jgi:N-formylglutamate amidohydrolase
VAGATAPVVIAVPHAGREYPADIVTRARTGLAGLALLEDRHADALTADAVAAGQCVMIARRGRAILDLNRHPAEIDAASVAGIPHNSPMRTSAKLRGGLGLVPHRYHGAGELWVRLPGFDEVRDRIATIHTPYHDALAQLLAATAAMQGSALLIDLHSMPPIRAGNGQAGVDIVIGDRFGQSADSDLTRRAMEIALDHGFRVAINTPYSGGYVLERHGRPAAAVHALQIEIDRTAYLDAALDRPGAGVARCRVLVADLADRLGRAVGDRVVPLAAE